MNLVCINCPRGCHLTVKKVEDKIVVEGNACPRGETYAINELTNPLRVVTTTIDIDSVKYKRLPVISSEALPKGKMMDVMKQLKNVKVVAPINRGDVVVENILGLNVNIISSKTIKE